MKRSIFAALTAFPLAGALVLAGCGERAGEAAPAQSAESEWTATPVIHQAVRDARGLRVTGVTAPRGRVVLRGGDGPAFATGSDAEGRFTLQISNQATDTLFAVESQRGEQAAPAPYDLLVAKDPAGPIVMLAEGAPSRRLDGQGVLDAIDSDGRALVASGRASPRSAVSIRAGDDVVLETVADAGGRWSAVLMPEGAGPTTVTMGERRYDYPGPGAAPTSVPGDRRAVRFDPAGQGWRAAWRLADGGWRSSWFPAR